MAAFVIDSPWHVHASHIVVRATPDRQGRFYAEAYPLRRRGRPPLRLARGGASPFARLRFAGGLTVAGASGGLRWSPMTPFTGHTLKIGHLRHPTARAIGQSVTAIGDSSMRRRGHR
jgi:hypothetical protein